jgi:hypothetical protein
MRTKEDILTLQREPSRFQPFESRLFGPHSGASQAPAHAHRPRQQPIIRASRSQPLLLVDMLRQCAEGSTLGGGEEIGEPLG